MKNRSIKLLNKNLLLGFVVSFSVQASFATNTTSTEKNISIQSSGTEALNDSKTEVTDQQKNKIKTEANKNIAAHEKKEKAAKPAEASNTNSQADSFSSYSFRPLLIQGKKRMAQKSKDMKVETGNIVESKLFFVDIDFKKRIFEDELGPE